MIPGEGDVFRRHQPAVGGHVHDVVNDFRRRRVGVLGEQLLRPDDLELLLVSML